MSGIDRDAWLSAVEAAVTVDTDPDALTMEEFARLIGKVRSTAQHVIKRLMETGKASKTRKRIIDTAGRSQYVTAYRLITEAPTDDRRPPHRVERRAGRHRHDPAGRS